MCCFKIFYPIQTSAASLPRLRLETRESERGKSGSKKAHLVKQSSAQNFMKSDGLLDTCCPFDHRPN